MKAVYISADFEGMSDVVSKLSVLRSGPDFTIARKRLANEVNAAVRACFDSGAEGVTICDGHADMENLIIEDLDPRVRLVSGGFRSSSLQMEGINKEYGAFISFGHSGAGLNAGGILNHCYNSQKIYNVRMNGTLMNTETVINAAIAGHYGIPLVAVIGDEAVCSEVKQFVPNCEGIAIKQGFSRHCAISYHPQICHKMISEGVVRALERLNEIKPLDLGSEITLEVDYKESNSADTAELIPGVERITPRTIRFKGDAKTVFKLQNLLFYRLIDDWQ